MRRIGSHLTFANIVSVIALFVALGGSALAAGVIISSNSQVASGTISGHKPPAGKHANIISGSVSASDLATGAVTLGKLAPNSVNGPKVVDDSVTGAEIRESTLGTVPRATSAGSAAIKGYALQGDVFSNPANQRSTGLVQCPFGTRPLGGGADVENPAKQHLSSSSPVGESWRVIVDNDAATDYSFGVSVICGAVLMPPG
jgi:hypothetical protein